jgi:hypothetical protein
MVAGYTRGLDACQIAFPGSLQAASSRRALPDTNLPDHSSLAVTTTYLRRLEGQEARIWERVAEASGCRRRLELLESAAWQA